MSKITIQTNAVDSDILAASKTITVDGTTLRTPHSVIPIQKTTGDLKPCEDSRGVNEIYRSFTESQLRRDKSGSSPAISTTLETAAETARSGDLNVCITTYKDSQRFSESTIGHLVDVLEDTAHFITVPLMPDLVQEIRDDATYEDDPFVRLYGNVEVFLAEAATEDRSRPVMGVLPPIPWEKNRNLLDLYLDHGIRAFCLNFNGTKAVGSSTFDNMIRPLLEEFSRTGLYREAFLYAVNARKGREVGGGYRPAEQFFAHGVGIDVIGGYHVPLSYEPPQREEPRVRVFNSHELALWDIHPSELPDYLPNGSGYDNDALVRMGQHDTSAQSVVSKLVISEQRALASIDLREAIDRGEAREFFENRLGVEQEVLARYDTVKQAFDDSESQSGISDFA